MASPQKENGFTPIAHTILENLATYVLSPNEWQILMIILRKTYGWDKKEDYISYSQFSEATNIHRHNVPKIIRKLISRNIIYKGVVCLNNGGLSKHTTPHSSVSITYGFQKDYDKWVRHTKNGGGLSKHTTPPLSKHTKRGLSKHTTTIDKYTKEIKDKERSGKKSLPVPDWIPKDTWDAYLEMRKEIKKPLKTDHAMKLAIDKLTKLKDTGNDPKLVLEQSIFNSWQGLFELKNGTFKSFKQIEEERKAEEIKQIRREMYEKHGQPLPEDLK